MLTSSLLSNFILMSDQREESSLEVEMSSPEPACTVPEDLLDTGTVSVKREPDDLLDTRTVSVKQEPGDLLDTGTVSIQYERQGLLDTGTVSVKQESDDLLDTNFLHLPVCEELPPERQKRSSRLVQEEPEPPHIKEEQEEITIKPEEADGSTSPLLGVKHKSEENGETEPRAGSSTEPMQTQAYIEYRVPSSDDQLLSSHCSESDITEDSDEWEETREGQSDSNTLKSHKTKPILRPLIKTPPLVKSSQHILSHTGEKPCVCTVCGRGFNRRDSLKCHMVIHTREKKKSFVCTVCGRGFNWMRGLKRHMMTHPGKKAFPPISRSKTTPLVKSSQHIQKKKPFVCTVCGRGFSWRCSLKNHMVIHTGEKPFVCTVCGRGFTRKHSLKCHMVIHTGEKSFVCTVCGRGFRWSRGLTRHMMTHPGKKALVKSSQLIQNSIQSHTGEKSFVCTVCGRGFRWRRNLKKHMFIHTGGKPFVCTVCGRDFSWRCSLKRHMVTHTGEKPFVCTVCGKGFSLRRTLKGHMVIHTGEKPFVCTVCGRGFSWRCNLRCHMMTHAGINPFPLILRPMTTPLVKITHLVKSSQHIQDSIQSPTGGKPFVCTVCGKGFREMCYLKSHMVSHTGEKPYVCTVCGRGFKEMSYIKHHMVSHTGEKPYMCTVCGRGFGWRVSLRNHMKTHAGQKPFPLVGQPIQSSSPTHTAEKPYMCTVCGRGFGWRVSLKNHMMTHAGEKPFPLVNSSQPIQSSIQEKPFMSQTEISRHLKDQTITHLVRGPGLKLILIPKTEPLGKITQTPKGEPFMCTVCGKGYCKLGGLNNHMTTHMAITCPVCGKGFICESHLKQHMATHTAQKLISCLDCGEGFTQTSHLQEHMSTHIVIGPEPIEPVQ